MGTDSGRTEADAGDKLEEEHIRDVSACWGSRLIGSRQRIDHIPVRHDLACANAHMPAPPSGLDTPKDSAMDISTLGSEVSSSHPIT